MRKRILIIIAIIIVLGGALFLFFRQPSSNTEGETLAQKTLNLFPFGKNTTTAPAENDETIIDTGGNSTTAEEPDIQEPRLRQLSQTPVAGATMLIKKRFIQAQTENTAITSSDIETVSPEITQEDATYVRYIEKGTGNIYDIAIDENSATRITNTTIPRLHEAYFVNQGEGVVLRYLENDMTTVSTWYGTITPTTPDQPSRLVGNFLDQNITTLSTSPDTRSIFFIKNIGDTTYGFTSNPDGSNIRQIFDSSFSKWLSEWSRPNEILLTAKASGFLEGYAYALASDGSSFKKILGPIFGLTTKSDNLGNYSLFSYATARGMQTRLYNETTMSQKTITINTFPEKCIWSKKTDSVYCAVPKSLESHVYPDEWYQGTYFTNDALWKIDASTGVGFLLTDIEEETGIAIDAVSLGISEDETFLYFINKQDNSLWGYSL